MDNHEIARMIGSMEVARTQALDPGLKTARIGDAFLTIDPASDTIYPSRNNNRVFNLGVESAAGPEMLDEIIACYKNAGVKRFFLYLSPSANEAAIKASLAERGMKVRNRLDILFRDTQSPPAMATDLAVRRIVPADLPFLTDCNLDNEPISIGRALAVIDDPRFTLFMAFDGDRPVAAGQVYVHGEQGWLGMAQTVPSHRNRGAHGALIAARVAAAAEQGCKWVYSETYKTILAGSYRNLIKNGFARVYDRPIHQWVDGKK